MIFNFTEKYQFSTGLMLNNQIVDSTKLLGTIISDDLHWDLNTKIIDGDLEKSGKFWSFR